MKGAAITLRAEFLALLLVAAFVAGTLFHTPQQSGTGLASAPPQETQHAVVTKVIDGDTVVIEGGEHVRLLGIDSDERGYPCYKAAKKRLEELVLNKNVTLEKTGKDKDQYGRLLRYIFLDGRNINLELVKEGLAVARFYSDDAHKKEILDAEKEAMKNHTGCKWKDLK